jgi:hypothetical protein
MTTACPDDLPPPTDLSHLSDEEFLALCPQGEHAPGPADPDYPPLWAPPPLWQAMEDAFLDGRTPGNSDRLGYAAVIRAVRDRLLPEESIEDAPGRFVNGRCFEDRQRLRALLTAEAERAERGT